MNLVSQKSTTSKKNSVQGDTVDEYLHAEAGPSDQHHFRKTYRTVDSCDSDKTPVLQLQDLRWRHVDREEDKAFHEGFGEAPKPA